jgi:GDP-4-dehydro-6-deoxy-D-mannose reductase
VAASWESPRSVYEINVLGQLHLLEALRRRQPMPTVVVASSAEIYGRVDHGDTPITEETPLRPASPYAVTKAAQDLQAAQYFIAHQLPIVRLRLFNHTGPGRPSRFVVSSFARQIAEIEAGLREPILRVGNLDVARDFTDVRDVVRAWRLAALKSVPGEAYNVCSGRATVVRTILDGLLAHSPRSITVEVDPARLRPGEIAVLYGDPARFTGDTGWQPDIPFEQTIADLLEWWRTTLRAADHQIESR